MGHYTLDGRSEGCGGKGQHGDRDHITLDLVNHAGEGLQILLGVTRAVYMHVLKEESAAVTLSGCIFKGPPWLPCGSG